MRAYDGNGLMGEHYEVDLNAAVNFVYRTYQGLTVTDAVKQFDGMKPVKVSEVTDPNYMDAVGRILPGDYTMTYDRNGRLTKDESRDVTSISYNRFVDRPSRITFGNGNFINNVYAPDGTLQSRTHSFRKLITTIKVNAKGDTIVSTANRTVNEGSFYYGNFEKTGGKLRLNTSAGYYDMETGENYQYLRNRQGSVMAVVNSRGETVQRTGLYPSGTPYILPCDYKAEGTNDMTPKTDHLHIGNHWMSQSGLNLYDNTARMHDPILCDMKSGDPKFFDYPSMNHFSFCGANPVNILDPLGENIFYFGSRGELIYQDESEDRDEVYVLNEERDIVSTMFFKSGTIKILETAGGKSGDVNCFQIDDENSSIQFFELLVDHTKVEYSLQRYESDIETSFITTSHDTDQERTGIALARNLTKKNMKRLYHVHNHRDSDTPSGTNTDGKYGDLDIYRSEDKRTNRLGNYFIYLNKNGVKQYSKINPYDQKYIFSPEYFKSLTQSQWMFEIKYSRPFRRYF